MLWQICKEWNYWDIAEQPTGRVLDTSISFNFPKCYVFSCQCNFLYMRSIVLQLSSRFWPTMHMYTVYDSLSGHFRGVVLRSQGLCNFFIICLLKIGKCKTILPLCCICWQCLLFLIYTFININRSYLWILKQHSLVLYILKPYLVVHIWIVRLHWKPGATGSPLHCVCGFNILLLLCHFVYWLLKWNETSIKMKFLKLKVLELYVLVLYINGLFSCWNIYLHKWNTLLVYKGTLDNL